MNKHDPRYIVTVDAETFYSTEFSLSKPDYNTSAYIRDAQFKTHCWAFKVGEKPTRWYKAAEAERKLRAIDWTKYALLAHNTAFDGFILAHHQKIFPRYYYDTLSMTRGLHSDQTRASLGVIAQFYGVGEKSKTYLTPTKGLRDLPSDIMQGLGEGCALDVDLCYEIFRRQLEVYPDEELDLIDMTVRMFCDSKLIVDINMARESLANEMLERRSKILKTKLGPDAEKVLQSNPKFAEELKKHGVEPPMQISAKTGTLNYAFSQGNGDFMDLLEHESIKVVRLMEARLAAKSTQAETRGHRFIQAGENGMALPVGYNYYGAKTGRWSGTNKLNLQNLPRVNPKEPRPSDGLRRSIMAPPGHVLVVVDSAQIEARVNAWLAGQDDMLHVFASKGDPYCVMASMIYGRPIDKDNDKLERFIGKIAVLGLGYGMGHKKFQTTLALGIMGPEVDLPITTCKKVVNLYRGTNHKIVKAWAEAQQILVNMAAGKSGVAFGGYIEYEPCTLWLPNGLGIHYSGLTRTESGDFLYAAHGQLKKVYGGLVIENIVQALARIVVSRQLLMVEAYLRTLALKPYEFARVSLITHDEIVTCVPARLAKDVLKNQLRIMKTVPEGFHGLPLDAEGGFDVRYSK